MSKKKHKKKTKVETKMPVEIQNKEETVKKIEEKIREQRQLPKEVLDNIHKRIFHNIIIASGIILYFIFLNLGFENVEYTAFITDLKVFTIGILALAILLFEYAYKKDSGIYCIYGIEACILSLVTMFAIYIRIMMEDHFTIIMYEISIVFAIYYIIKSIIIYLKAKKKHLISTNDIKEIIKK